MRVMPTSRLALPGANRSSGDTIRSLLPYLWPSGDPGARARVVIAMALLILAKVATVYIPIIYSRSVDALTPKGAAIIVIPAALIVAYGLLRLASAGFAELRDAVFAAVQQRTVRRVALQTFQHMHRLSMRFHLDRQTGGVSRAGSTVNEISFTAESVLPCSAPICELIRGHGPSQFVKTKSATQTWPSRAALENVRPS